jgi:prepilin-type N-terminal cleavage/methylation domain-containing protein
MWDREEAMMPTKKRTAESGFSLIEMMITLVIMTIIMGAVFQQLTIIIQRSQTEQIKLDLYQEAREFMDQMSRDLHQAGYPNQRNFGPAALATPTTNDAKNAVGLVRVAAGELVFEGDVDGTGLVSSVAYHLDSTAVGCAPPAKPCLRRSQVTPKTTGDPATEQVSATFQTEVQNVQNDITQLQGAIFSAFRADGTQVTLPVQIDISNPTAAVNATLASINTIRVVLIVQSNAVDRPTGVKPVTTLVSTVKLNNCSQAVNSMAMSCQ